jgi:hypothetical protein
MVKEIRNSNNHFRYTIIVNICNDLESQEKNYSEKANILIIFSPGIKQMQS